MYKGEKFNSISHLVGASLALIGFVSLVVVGANTGSIVTLISFVVFGFCLLALYLMSTLYHSLRPVKAKKVFQKLDHISIYLLIAGTYTPYMLVSLGDGLGPWLLAAVWGLGLFGVLLELFKEKRNELLQLTIYLLMGWMCVLDFSQLKAAMPSAGIYWLIGGGIAYSVGIVFYVLDERQKMNHAHGIWHLFVLVGSVSHYISVIGYVR